MCSAFGQLVREPRLLERDADRRAQTAPAAISGPAVRRRPQKLSQAARQAIAQPIGSAAVSDLVITEDREAVRHVVLNRPEKRNAFNEELVLAIGAALRAAADDPVRALRRAARQRPGLLRRHGRRRARERRRARPSGCARSAAPAWRRGTCARR